MTPNSLKSLGVPFLEHVLVAFQATVPAVRARQAAEQLRSLALESSAPSTEVFQDALAALSGLQELTKQGLARVSLEALSQSFAALNHCMPDEQLSDLDLVYLAAIIKTTLELGAAAARRPELQAWLNRRAAQDFKRLWLALLGMRVNPFSLGHPLDMADFDNEFSHLLSLLVGRRGVVLVEGAPGTGKTAFLRKACASLLRHQMEQKPIVTTYVENKRGNAKEFVTDIYAGFFHRYLFETPHLRDALKETLPLGTEQRVAWMEHREKAIRESVFLPSHALEHLFKRTTATDLFRTIAGFTRRNGLSLVVLVDDMDGKIRTTLSTTQINLLLSLQDECAPCFIIASVKPRGRIPRAIADRSVGMLIVPGLSKGDVQSMIQAFFNDSRTTLSNRAQALDRTAVVGQKQLLELLFDEAIESVLSESYIERRPTGSLFRPRSVVGICERILEGVASDVSNIRLGPRKEEVLEAMKAFVTVNP